MLRENESGKELFHKRILWISLVIVSFFVLYETGLKGRASVYADFIFNVIAVGSGLSAVLVFIQLSLCVYNPAYFASLDTEYAEKYCSGT